jgi:hypothetical protein
VVPWSGSRPRCLMGAATTRVLSELRRSVSKLENSNNFAPSRTGKNAGKNVGEWGGKLHKSICNLTSFDANKPLKLGGLRKVGG